MIVKARPSSASARNRSVSRILFAPFAGDSLRFNGARQPGQGAPGFRRLTWPSRTEHIIQPEMALYPDIDAADTVPINVRLLEIQHTNVGLVRAYAADEVEVAGICFVIQGITVTQHKREVHVDLPTYQRDGRRLPTFCLPDELIEPVGKLVFEAYKELADCSAAVTALPAFLSGLPSRAWGMKGRRRCH
jgi:hypothetical protein